MVNPNDSVKNPTLEPLAKGAGTLSLVYVTVLAKEQRDILTTFTYIGAQGRRVTPIIAGMEESIVARTLVKFVKFDIREVRWFQPDVNENV